MFAELVGSAISNPLATFPRWSKPAYGAVLMPLMALNHQEGSLSNSETSRRVYRPLRLLDSSQV